MDDRAADELTARLLFSESNTRFLCEVTEEKMDSLKSCLADVPMAEIGTVNDSGVVEFRSNGTTHIQSDISKLKTAWQSPLDWE